MEELRRLTYDTLRRIEETLMSRARWAQINAFFSLADPSLVLPSPAVSVLAAAPDAGLYVDGRTVFRSLTPMSSDGELLLTPVCESVSLQPWTVGGAVWMDGPRAMAEKPQDAVRTASGLRLLLRREMRSEPTADWMPIFFDGDPMLAWALLSATAACKERRIEYRPPGSWSFTAPAGFPGDGVFQHHLRALAGYLAAIRLPGELCDQAELTIDLRFEEPIPLPLETTAPRAYPNAFLAWNSIEQRYPEYDDVVQAVSETGRFLHPLTARGLGPSWRPWSVVRVGAAASAAPCFAARPALFGIHRNAAPHFALCYAPETARTSDATLSILLSDEARRSLDESRQSLGAIFRLTTGAHGNGVAAGQEFQGSLAAAPLGLDLLAARLVVPTWGGMEGVTPAAFDGADTRETMPRLRALLGPGAVRTVNDVRRVIEHVFGHEIGLESERSLLRFGDEAAPLQIGVRFCRPGRPGSFKRAVLASCRSFLESYFDGASAGAFDLVEVE